MPKTIYDIAKAAGVSIATVSRVFNQTNTVKETTRDRVLKVADEMGYHPQAYAQGLASKKKNSIMMLVPVMSNYFFTEILRGIQDKLKNHNFELNIVNIKQEEDPFRQVEHLLKRQWAEGYLLVSLHLKKKQLESLKKFKVPICLVDDLHTDFDSVSFNNEQGAYMATRYLLDKGYTRIVNLSGSATAIPVQDRLNGYKKALSEKNIEFDPSLVITGKDMQRDGFTEKSGYEAMQQILSLDPVPEAVFCNSDIKAVGALKAMQEKMVKIPMVCFDNLTISEYIGLSTVHQPMYQMGFNATEKLIHRMTDPQTEISHDMHAPELIIRSSSETRNSFNHSE